MKYNCKECKYYLPIDVFKGICKISKDNIKPDTDECINFEKNPFCKFCTNFTLSENNEILGKCKKITDAYPDMNAQNCKDFDWTK